MQRDGLERCEGQPLEDAGFSLACVASENARRLHHDQKETEKAKRNPCTLRNPPDLCISRSHQTNTHRSLGLFPPWKIEFM